METIERSIALPSPHHRLVLLPFACTHWDSPYCHVELIEQFVRRAAAPDTYTIGLGDYLDFARTHKRTALRAALPGDDDTGELLDALVADRVDRYIQLISPLRYRCLGLVEGNHRYEFMTTNPQRGWVAGETTTAYMARRLGVPYLAHLGQIILMITLGDKELDRIVILASHGYGTTAASVGADLNKLERYLQSFQADIIITAHTHRRVAYIQPVMLPTPEGFVEKPVLLIKAGSFLRAYVPGRSSYAEQKFLRPLDLGWVEIDIRYDESGRRQVRAILPSRS